MPITLGLDDQPVRYQGELAGQRVLSPLACHFLQESGSVPAFPVLRFPESLPLSMIAELEQRRYAVRGAHTAELSAFHFSDGAKLTVSRDGSHAQISEACQAPASWLFGPALILSLARRGTFCLHASALADARGAVLYVAVSGAGKSTLARHASLLGARRLTDDITPLRCGPEGLEVLPQFPQLKLVSQESALPQAVPLRRICWLGAPAPLQMQKLGSSALALGILGHTVAAKLFSPENLRKHLAFAAALSAHLQASGGGYALNVPWQPEQLDRVMLSALQLSLAP